MSYIGMDKANCAIQTTQLYTFTNSSASLVWNIEAVSRSVGSRNSAHAGAECEQAQHPACLMFDGTTLPQHLPYRSHLILPSSTQPASKATRCM